MILGPLALETRSLFDTLGSPQVSPSPGTACAVRSLSSLRSATPDGAGSVQGQREGTVLPCSPPSLPERGPVRCWRGPLAALHCALRVGVARRCPAWTRALPAPGLTLSVMVSGAGGPAQLTSPCRPGSRQGRTPLGRHRTAFRAGSPPRGAGSHPVALIGLLCAQRKVLGPSQGQGQLSAYGL